MRFITYFNLLTALFFGLIWVGALTYLRVKKKKSFAYLLFFSLFYAYIFMVLDYTLFRLQSLLLLKHFVPHLMLKGEEAGQAINLIPIVTLKLKDVQTSLLNILLFVPFGFGLPFITNLRIKKVVTVGALFSMTIELMQLLTGLLAKMTFRVADINDVIFNTAGVVVGYILFIGFVRIYRRVSRNWNISAHPILQYITERPQIGDASNR